MSIGSAARMPYLLRLYLFGVLKRSFRRVRHAGGGCTRILMFESALDVTSEREVGSVL
jgi:hypothetical protein